MASTMTGRIGALVSPPLACPPRFGTARNLDRLTLGHQVGEVAERLGKPLMPWQQYMADVSMELDEDGRLVYGEVDVVGPRQQGKTAWDVAKSVHRLVVMARTHGPQRLTYTAQTRIAARKKLEQSFAETLRAARKSFPEVTAARGHPRTPSQWKLSKNNGSEHIKFGTGSFWQIDAPTRTGGHGDTLDEGHIDEAFAHDDDAVEGSMRPAQSTRDDAQLVVLSASGDANSKYLWRKVLAGRDQIERGHSGPVAYFEWSAPDDADPADPATWRACMPALGVTVAESFVRSEWVRLSRKGHEGKAMFCRMYLAMWPEVPVLDEDEAEVVVPRAAWSLCHDEGTSPADPVAVAFDVSPDRKWSSIAAAGEVELKDGSPGTGVELLEHRSGTGWVIDRLLELRARNGVRSVVCDKNGPSGALLARAEAAGLTVSGLSGPQCTAACGAFFDDIVDNRIRVRAQPDLDDAVADAVKHAEGRAWRWSRAVGDSTPLWAATLAHAAHLAPPLEEAAPVAEFYTV